jgi:hypothetical protein
VKDRVPGHPHQQVPLPPLGPHHPARQRLPERILLPILAFREPDQRGLHEPLIAYPSGVHQGQNINTPQNTFQTKYQFRDDFSFSRTLGGRRHDFKIGVNFVHEPELGGSSDTAVDAPQFLLLEEIRKRRLETKVPPE